MTDAPQPLADDQALPLAACWACGRPSSLTHYTGLCARCERTHTTQENR